jgi:hypothetical protein
MIDLKRQRLQVFVDWIRLDRGKAEAGSCGLPCSLQDSQHLRQHCVPPTAKLSSDVPSASPITSTLLVGDTWQHVATILA